MASVIPESTTGRKSTLKYLCPIFVGSLSLILPFVLHAQQADQESARQHFEAGFQAIRQKNFPEAEKQLKAGLRLNPRSPAGYDLLGAAYDGLGRFAEAEQAYRQALQLNPRLVGAYNDLGRSLYRQNKSKEAVAEFVKAIDIDPKNFTANYNLGIIALELKDYSRAVQYLNVARARAPTDVQTLLALTKALLGIGKTDQALVAAQALVAVNPDDVQIRFSLGTLFLEGKLYREAAEQLERGRVAEPGNFELLYNLGQAYTHLGKFSEAEDVFLRASAIRPDSADPLYQLAVVYAQAGRHDEAIQVLVRARQRAPTRPEILLLLGRESIHEGFIEDAVAVLQDSAQLDPGKVEPHLLLGEALTRDLQFEAALKEYKTLSELEPPNVRSFVALGRTYWYMGRHEEALQALNKAIALDPTNAEACYFQGLIAAKNSDYSTAERWFERALRSEPRHLGALYEMGATLAKRHEYARASEYLEQATSVAPRFPQAYYRLAAVYRQLGDPHRAEEALTLFRKYDALDEERRTNRPRGMIEFLENTQALPERQRLERYREALLKGEKLRGDDPNLLLMLARIELQLGNKSEVLRRIEQVTSARPDSVPILLRAASMLAETGCYREAYNQLNSSVARQPAVQEVRFALAALDLQLCRNQEALQALTSMPSPGGPSAAAYHNLLGRVWSRQGNSAVAVAEFSRATNLDPQNDEYWMNLVLEIMRAGSTEEAGRTLAEAQKRLPSSPRLYFTLGVWQALAGHPAEAEKALHRAIDLSWLWDLPYIALGLVVKQGPSGGNFLAPLDEVASLVPQSPWTPLFRALALDSAGPSDVNQLASSLRKSLEWTDRQPEALPFLLVVSLKKRDCGLAREVWSRMQTLGFAEDLNPTGSCSPDAGFGSAKPAKWLDSTERLSDLKLLAEVATQATSMHVPYLM